MDDLQIFEQNGILLADSRDVAQMVDRDHAALLKTIRVYLDYLNGGKIDGVQFFTESTYQDNKGQTQPCYLITKKGCDMIANKMTGAKGILFTAAYVAKFDQMERMLKGHLLVKPMTQAEIVAAQAQLLVDMERRLDTVETMILDVGSKAEETVAKLGTAIKVYSRPDKDHWTTDMSESIRGIAGADGWAEIRLRGKLYRELEDTAKVNVTARLARLQERVRRQGTTYKESRTLTKLDAISKDAKLRSIFEGIVKKHQAMLPANGGETDG